MPVFCGIRTRYEIYLGTVQRRTQDVTIQLSLVIDITVKDNVPADPLSLNYLQSSKLSIRGAIEDRASCREMRSFKSWSHRIVSGSDVRSRYATRRDDHTYIIGAITRTTPRVCRRLYLKKSNMWGEANHSEEAPRFHSIHLFPCNVIRPYCWIPSKCSP